MSASEAATRPPSWAGRAVVGRLGVAMAALRYMYLAFVALLLAAVFELPHHFPRARLVSCRKVDVPDAGLCVASPRTTGSLLQFFAQQGVEPELEHFACSELHRSLPCALPSQREHAGRNCFNKRPRGTLLRPVSASGGSGPGGRQWDWQPKVGEYIDGNAEEQEAQLTFTMGSSEQAEYSGKDAFRWTRVPVWASLWHKPWAKIKLMLRNEDGGSSEMEVTRSSLGYNYRCASRSCLCWRSNLFLLIGCCVESTQAQG